MAASRVENTWQDDDLRNDLSQYILQGLQRREILHFAKPYDPYYACSICTLDCLKAFDLYYIDKNVSISSAKVVICKEMHGPGKLLGYRAMQTKIRQKYGLKIPCDRTYDLMYDTDPDLLENRQPGLKKKQRTKHFTSNGPNWILSVDGHDKLMGFQNSTFPLAIYEGVDTFSRKLLWLKMWITNSRPEFIGNKWYLEYLFESRKLPDFMRMNCGTETGIMATMQSYLRRNHGDLEDPTDSIMYGPSTSNQVLDYACTIFSLLFLLTLIMTTEQEHQFTSIVLYNHKLSLVSLLYIYSYILHIERWWSELHERLEKYFKQDLSWLRQQGHYDSNNEVNRLG